MFLLELRMMVSEFQKILEKIYLIDLFKKINHLIEKMKEAV